MYPCWGWSRTRLSNAFTDAYVPGLWQLFFFLSSISPQIIQSPQATLLVYCNFPHDIFLDDTVHHHHMNTIELLRRQFCKGWADSGFTDSLMIVSCSVFAMTCTSSSSTIQMPVFALDSPSHLRQSCPWHASREVADWQDCSKAIFYFVTTDYPCFPMNIP